MIMSSNEKKQRFMRPFWLLLASSAFWLTARMPRPVGSMKPFCEPETQQSTPHSPMRMSSEPTEDTPSTNSSAGCLAASSAFRTPAMSLADAGRRFVLRGEHGLDFVVLVLGEDIGVLLERNARAPLFIAKLDLETEALGHVDPEQRELAEAAHQNLVADGERVLDRRFPGARARRREDEYAAVLHLEDLLQILEHRQRELRKLGRAHVFHGKVHGHAHGVWNCRRAGDEKVRRNGH